MEKIGDLIKKIPFALFAKHFVAGENIDDAFRVARKLQEKGFGVIFNILGERAKNLSQVFEFTRENLELLCRIKEDKRLDINKSRLSLKLSQLGLDFNEDLCRENLFRLVVEAGDNIMLEIDREDPEFAKKVRKIFIEAYDHLNHKNMRLTLQLNLERSHEELIESEMVYGNHFRLCKGAYKGDYDNEKKLRLLFFTLFSHMKFLPESRYSRDTSSLAVATHDPMLIDKIVEEAEKKSLSPICEFQFLYGLSMKKAEELLRKGWLVWIYLPFGKEWFSYGKRRWKSLAKILIRNILYKYKIKKAAF